MIGCRRVTEVLAQLSHFEGPCYRARRERFLAEEMPRFDPEDAQIHVDRYRNADPEEDFAHFEEQREVDIEFLRGLPASAGARKARHREAGEVTLAGMLPE